MDKLKQATTASVAELQQTILLLRAQLEQSDAIRKKHHRELNQEFSLTQVTLEKTIVKLRQEITALHTQLKEKDELFNRGKILFQNEKINLDKHFQKHLSETRNQFEQDILQLQISNQQQLKHKQTEIDALQQQLIHLRKQIDLSSMESD